MSKFITLSKLKTALTPIMNIVNKKANESDLSAVAKTGRYEDLDGMVDETSIPESIARISQVNDLIKTDTTLSLAGKAADAAATGKAINNINSNFNNYATTNDIHNIERILTGTSGNRHNFLLDPMKASNHYDVLPGGYGVADNYQFDIVLPLYNGDVDWFEIRYKGMLIYSSGVTASTDNEGTSYAICNFSCHYPSLSLTELSLYGFDVIFSCYGSEISAEDITSKIYLRFCRKNGVSDIVAPNWWEIYHDKPVLATVATTGNYNDLLNTPTLATVATTGSYRDLTDKPAITSTFVEFVDKSQNIVYRVAVRDGNLIIYSPIDSISVKTPPNKTEYMAGEPFDTTGIVLTATTIDGISQKEVYECIAPNPYLSYGQTSIELQYTDEDGDVHTTSTPVTVTPFDPTEKLVDFTYTVNDDGTYTLTGWKQTLNGITSTEMVIPDNGLIVL